MFKKKTKHSKPLTSEEEVSKLPLSHVKFSEELEELEERGNLDIRFTNIDFSDVDNPKIEHQGEWWPLELYQTDVSIILTDVTFEGGWFGAHRHRSGERTWSEKLVATARLLSGSFSKRPILTFFDHSHNDPRYSIFSAAYSTTSIWIDHEFTKFEVMSEEERDFDNFYKGSPVKLFRTPDEADKFINYELIVYSEERGLYPDAVKAKDGCLQSYRWPEVLLGGNEFRSHDLATHKGFSGSSIAVPKDVYDGIRRAIVDFKDETYIEVIAEMELYGLDVRKFDHTLEPASARISIVPLEQVR